MQDLQIRILDSKMGGPCVEIEESADIEGGRMQCNTDDEARAYARGLEDGWNRCRRMIGQARVRYAFPSPNKESR